MKDKSKTFRLHSFAFASYDLRDNEELNARDNGKHEENRRERTRANHNYHLSW